MKFDGFDIGLNTLWSTEDLVRCAKLSEKYGAETFWVAEQYHNRSCTPAITLALSNTKRINVGVGILSPFTRHPALIAMEAATIDEYFKGRFILGLGAARFSLLRHAALNVKAYTGIREAIEIIRKLISHKTVTYEGKVFRLTPPGTLLGFSPYRKKIPIHIGAMGPRLFELAGELSDGLFLGTFASPGLVKFAREAMVRGAKKAGRDPNKIPLRSYVLFSVAKDSHAAKQAVKQTMASYLSENLAYFRFKHAGVKEEELRSVQEGVRKHLDVWGAGDMKEAAKVISDDLVDRLVVAGNPDECVSKLQKWADAGLNYVIPYQVLGRNLEEGIRLLGTEVMPHLTKGKKH